MSSELKVHHCNLLSGTELKLSGQIRLCSKSVDHAYWNLSPLIVDLESEDTLLGHKSQLSFHILVPLVVSS